LLRIALFFDGAFAMMNYLTVSTVSTTAAAVSAATAVESATLTTAVLFEPQAAKARTITITVNDKIVFLMFVFCF